MAELTSDRNDPRLSWGSDSEPGPQNEAYLILSAEERAEGFVRPVRRAYMHIQCPEDVANHSKTDIFGKPFGPLTTMSSDIAETYARNPKFYGATYCCACQMHRPVTEFIWDDGTGETVGS